MKLGDDKTVFSDWEVKMRDAMEQAYLSLTGIHRISELLGKYQKRSQWKRGDNQNREHRRGRTRSDSQRKVLE